MGDGYNSLGSVEEGGQSFGSMQEVYEVCIVHSQSFLFYFAIWFSPIMTDVPSHD